MNKKISITRQIAWISAIPQMSVLVIILLIMNSLNIKDGLMWTAIVYLCISMLSKNTIAYHFKKGMNHLRKGEYKAAIKMYEKSYDFFSKHQWVDKFRFVTLLSSSKASYKEMSLINVGFCYGCLDDTKKAKEYYNKALKEFPDSEMAKTGLESIASYEKDKKHG